MEIKPEVLDEWLKGLKTQQDLMGPNGLVCWNGFWRGN
jgi:hypothetical protein